MHGDSSSPSIFHEFKDNTSSHLKPKPTTMSTANGTTPYSFGNPPPMGNPAMGELIGTPGPAPQLIPMRNYRPDSLAQPFKMRDRLKEPVPMIGYGLGLAAPEVAR